MACLNSSFSDIAASTHVVAAIKMAKQNRRMSDASIPSTCVFAFPSTPTLIHLEGEIRCEGNNGTLLSSCDEARGRRWPPKTQIT